MINKSISYKLTIYISIAVISVFVAFILVLYLFNRNILKEKIESTAIGLSSEVIMDVEKYVILTEDITQNVSEQILYYGQNNHAELLISNMMERYDFVDGIHVNIDSDIPNLEFHNYLGYRSKDSVFVEKDHEIIYHCLEEKKILEQYFEQGRRGWTEPFQCNSKENIVVYYSSPIELLNSDGSSGKIGSVICELSLLQLNDSINSIKIGESERGFAFLVSEKGFYLTHPVKEWILNRNIFDISEKVYKTNKQDVYNIIKNRESGALIAFSEILDYEKTWIYYTPLKETGWFLIFAVPYNDLFQPLYLTLLRLLFISVIGILIIYFIIAYISKKLIDPLSDITAQLSKFSNLSGLQQLEGENLNEIHAVSESLNSLRSWYEKYKINQTIELKKNHRQKEDLKEASEIQRSLIKTDFPAFPDKKEIDLYTIYKPAKVISGDLYDYFFIDDENLIFTIGDVSGKGIPAAFFMSIAQTIIKNNAISKKAKNIVDKANRELYTNNQHQFFLTLFLGVLNIKTGRLNYCNAAHTPAFILKSNGEVEVLAQSHGLPLGLYPDKEYSDSKVKIKNGDTIILYTDGVTEIQDENKLIFGEERFKENVSHLAGKEPKEIAERIEKSLNIFRGKVKQSDDISLLIIRFFSEKKA